MLQLRYNQVKLLIGRKSHQVHVHIQSLPTTILTAQNALPQLEVLPFATSWDVMEFAVSAVTGPDQIRISVRSLTSLLGFVTGMHDFSDSGKS